MEFEVITANYNNSKFLDDFFSSIIDSSIKPKKIIFVDDVKYESVKLALNTLKISRPKLMNYIKNGKAYYAE